MEEALVAQLLANAGVAALVANRITWDLRDENGALPAIVLQLVDAPPDYTLKRRTGFIAALIQADCWAGNGKAAKDVADALVAALDGLGDPFTQPGLVGRRRRDAFRTEAPQTGGSAKLHRTSLDVRVWFSEA